ncbi:MAG: hypothetical protein WKF75_00440 [Singulisphaera sp.]
MRVWAQVVAREQGRPSSRLDAMRRMAGTATVAEVNEGKAGTRHALQTEPLTHNGDPGLGSREGNLWAWVSAGGRRR